MGVEVQADRNENPADRLPSTHFRNYCLAEFERQRNSGEEFQEDGYRSAMDLVLLKLRALEERQSP